jgi:hypothetical protein
MEGEGGGREKEEGGRGGKEKGEGEGRGGRCVCANAYVHADGGVRPRGRGFYCVGGR